MHYFLETIGLIVVAVFIMVTLFVDIFVIYSGQINVDKLQEKLDEIDERLDKLESED